MKPLKHIFVLILLLLAGISPIGATSFENNTNQAFFYPLQIPEISHHYDEGLEPDSLLEVIGPWTDIDAIEQYTSPCGTPIGDAANGYQVVKNGNEIAVKRVPETGDYTQGGYLTKLTEHPEAHVLERHGHDVTDDALIKRAKDGIAPDGSYIGNATNPYKPFSSKFNDSDMVKLAYDKTNPTSPAWASRTPNQYGGWDVIYEDTNIIFGKGIEPPGTAAFENLTKVKASYVEVSSGVFQLVTMFPIK